MTYSESLGFEETHPPGLELELTDNKDATMGGSGMVGNTPPNCARKLKQSTLFVCLFVLSRSSLLRFDKRLPDLGGICPVVT